MIDLIILASLLDGPKHGYALKKQAGMVFTHSQLHNNLVYPLLRRFTSQGWVTKKSAPGERGQTRQQYALTLAGRRALLDHLKTFGEKEAQSSEEFLVRAGLFALLERKDHEEILSARQRILQRRDAHFAQLQQMELGLYGGEVVGFLRDGVNRELAWLEHLRRVGNANGPAAMAGNSRQPAPARRRTTHDSKLRSTR